jgi:phosphinothricin acetyltransferase
MTPVEIAPAVEADLPGIVEIFNYTAANSIANFGTRPVSVADRRDWFGQFSSAGCHRLFVARRDGQVMGYAGSQRYRRHEAFTETVEVSIALHVSCRGQGAGSALYRELFGCLAGEKIHVALAGIACPTMRRSRCTGNSALPRWARSASTPLRMGSTSARYGCSAWPRPCSDRR